MTREAFENVIVVCSAIGGSTNAPIHLNAIAAHMGVPLDNDDWERIGHHIPLLVDLQPAGRFLGEDFFRAGGVPAVVAELLAAGALPHPDAAHRQRPDHRRELRGPLHRGPRGHPHLRGADAAGCRLPEPQGQPVRLGDHEDERHLRIVPGALPVRPGRPGRLRGQGRSCSTGARTTTRASTTPRSSIDERTLLVMRGAGPHRAIPGAAEVVNMQPPDALLVQGIDELPCIGDGRQSGTSGSPSILNASPGGGRGRWAGAAAYRRPGAHRPAAADGRRPAPGGGAGGAARRARRRSLDGRRAALRAGEPDALAGDPAGHGRPARPGAWCWSPRSSTRTSATGRARSRETTTRPQRER